MSRVTDITTSTMPFSMVQAINEIRSSYGDIVDVASKAKSLLKFGNNPDLGTSWETVWSYGGDETYVTTNAIDKISSSNAGDTETIRIEGHTVSGTGTDSQFTFVTQDVVLAGQTETALTTPLARVARAYDIGTTGLLGDIYIYEDDTVTAGVPQTTSKVHLKIPISGSNQSYKAATTFSNDDYFICTNVWGSIVKTTSGAVDFEVQVRLPGKTFRPLCRFSVHSNGATTTQIKFDPYLVIQKNSDMRVIAIGSTNNIEVNASFQGYLARVIGTV